MGEQGEGGSVSHVGRVMEAQAADAGARGNGDFGLAAHAGAHRAGEVGGEAEQEARQEFGSYVEFLFVCVGYAVGVGNFIIFPGRVYNNGGGSFLIAYWLCLFAIGVPLYALELKLGQWSQRGAFHTCLAMNPRLWGLGLTSVLMSIVINTYYSVIIAWTTIYFYYSFFSPLPWEGRPEEFFFEDILHSTQSIAHTGGINWPIFAANAAVWAAVALILAKGVVSSGKVAYVTVIVPYLCLALLLGRALTLPGASTGIREYLAIDMAKLAAFETWARAGSQIFYSLGVGFGALIAFGSYRPGNSDYVKDAIVVPIVNCVTSFVGGFAIFGMLGYLSYVHRASGTESQQDCNQLSCSGLEVEGFGVAFIAYSEGLSHFQNGWAQFFSCLFFAMLFCLGINSMIGQVEVVVTFLKDTHVPMGDTALSFLVCICGFLLGIPCMTDAGYYWITLLWDYGNYTSLFVVVIATMIAASWVLGREWMDKASLAMRSKKANPVLVVLWRYVDPVVLVLLMVTSVVALVPWPDTLGAHGDGTGGYPVWAMVLSGLANFAPILVILVPLVIPIKCFKRLKSMTQCSQNNELASEMVVLSTGQIDSTCCTSED